MPQNKRLKLTLYLKQNNIVISFLLVFSVINIVYATNYYWAILFCGLVSTLFYFSANQFIKSENPESGGKDVPADGHYADLLECATVLAKILEN